MIGKTIHGKQKALAALETVESPESHMPILKYCLHFRNKAMHPGTPRHPMTHMTRADKSTPGLHWLVVVGPLVVGYLLAEQPGQHLRHEVNYSKLFQIPLSDHSLQFHWRLLCWQGCRCAHWCCQLTFLDLASILTLERTICGKQK